MSATYPTTVTVTHRNAAGTVSNSRTYETETFQPIKVTLTSSQANKKVDVAFPYARLKSIIVKTPVDIHIYTNAASSGSPANTLVIASETGLDWDVDSGFTNPFSANVTSFYFTNDEAVAVTADNPIEILIALDPTA